MYTEGHCVGDSDPATIQKTAVLQVEWELTNTAGAWPKGGGHS